MKRVQVLDHGYVEVIESWGSDERIIEAARMSTQKGFEGWGTKSCDACGPGVPIDALRCPTCGDMNKFSGSKTGDEKLLAYLWKNNHATPFEMAGAIIEVQAPIMVFREWHRHRTQSYNEMSARYAPLPDLNYVPTVDRLLLNSKQNKQAGVIAGAEELTESVAVELMDEERAFNEAAERFYQKKLKAGVPKELARTHLGVSRISRMRASANLRNWLGFLTLRADSKAQWEIRQYAFEVAAFLGALFPRTMSLFNEGRKQP
jgi:thymidylate synthase (FAD)